MNSVKHGEAALLTKTSRAAGSLFDVASAAAPLRRKVPSLLFGGTVVMAALLCFHGLARQPLWNDEAFSYFVARSDLAATLAWVRQDTHPPFYYLMLNEWMTLGRTPLVLRSLSAVAVVAALFPLYGAARILLGWPAAVIAALLFALDPNCVLWAQKARPYALQTFMIAVSFWGFAKFWTEPAQVVPGAGLWRLIRTGHMREVTPDLGWLSYAAAGALAMLTQYPAGFFLFGCNVAVLLRWALHPRSESTRLLKWVVAQLLLLAVCAPWIPSFIGQFSEHLTAGQIAARHLNFIVSGTGVVSILRGLLAVPTLWRAQLPFFVLFVLVAVSGALVAARQPRARPILFATGVPIAVCLLGFWLVHPIFGYVIYTFNWLLVPYAMLLAVGLLAMRPRWLGMAVAALLVLGDAWGLANYQSVTHEPLDRIAATIGEQMRAGDGLLLTADKAALWGIGYYLGTPYEGRLAGLALRRLPDDGSLIGSVQQAAEARRLWVVLPEDGQPAVPLDRFDPGAVILHQRMGEFTVDLHDRSAGAQTK